MKLIREKLQSQRGASILFAISAFMIVTVLSLSMMQGTFMNISRVQGQQKYEQQHLAALSAVQYLKDVLQDDSFIILQMEDDTSLQVIYTDEKNDTPQIIEDCLTGLIEKDFSVREPAIFNLNVSPESGTQIEGVQAYIKLTIDQDYAIKAEVTGGGKVENGGISGGYTVLLMSLPPSSINSSSDFEIKREFQPWQIYIQKMETK